jgi:hypothetical protein
MRITFTFLTAAAAALLAGSCERKSDFRPVASVKQLMEATVAPSADAIFDAVGTVVSSSGVEEIAPKNDKEWTAVRNSALNLAESGNLLMIGHRARDNREWIRMSQALVDVAVVAVKAADAKDPAALFDAGAHVHDVCEQCHSRYWSEAGAAPKP